MVSATESSYTGETKSRISTRVSTVLERVTRDFFRRRLQKKIRRPVDLLHGD
jgi:hypothetical protein